MKNDPMPPVERHRRATLALARLTEEVGALGIKLAERNPTNLVTSQTLVELGDAHAASLAEYAGMIDDALAGREPYAKNARARKCRRAPSERAMTTTTKSPRRLTEKRVTAILVEYDLRGKVRAYLATLGELVWTRPINEAVWHSHLEPPPFRFVTPARHRDWAILTRRGMLGVSVHPGDDAIMCVFDDDEAGAHVGASRPSGKWNRHAFVGYVHKPTSRDEMVAKLDETLSNFVADLAWIVDRRFHTDTRAMLASLEPR